MKLYKEIAKIREEIERDKSTTIESYGREGANIERFIKLISHGWNCGNAVKFAIQRKSLGCVVEIFKILTDNVRNHPEIRYILRSLDRYIVRLARTKNVHAEGDALIVNAIKNEQHIPVLFLLESLEDEQRYNLIEQKGCKSDCSGNPHGEGCNAEYNLLMLALETSPDDGFLPSYIVDFVCGHQDLEYKTEIAMGKQKPEIYRQTPNSIRLAAATDKTRLAIRLLRDCLPPEKCYGASLEVGPPKVSAIASMIDVNGIESLQMLGEQNQGILLHQTLKNSAGMHNNFLELKMKQDAIEYFDKIQALENKYLIPKPSELSRPMALIFYNTFAGADRQLLETENEAVCLKNALQSLGWLDDEITISPPQWTFDQLIDQLENSITEKGNHCSLFLLYITSHGKANRVCGTPESGDEYSSGSIHGITDIVTLLPKYIPKVIIFDTCRTGVTIASHTITDENTLLIHATLLGHEAAQNLYIPELANQIIELADNGVPFHDIHMNAAQNIACQRSQIPILKSTANKKIVLRRYDGNENNCMSCKMDIKNCYRECMICSNCFRWYHVTCAGCTQADIELFKRSKLAKLKCPKCLAYALG